MSTKKISAGDTLTVGDLTDDYLGAVIEVGPTDGGITFRFRLDRIECYGTSQVKMLTTEGGAKHADLGERVTVITPPPVVQPDAPEAIGQMFVVEGLPESYGFRAKERGTSGLAFWWKMRSDYWTWGDWESIKRYAGDHRIFVLDPPVWPGDVDDSPMAGDRFDRLEDMPYGWIAKVTLADGTPWGCVVRHDDDWVTHLWDFNHVYAHMETGGWHKCGAATRSGGSDGVTAYTLVETAEDHDERIRSERAVPERIEEDEL